jgi:alkylhydroperoxidase family enzyme
VVLLRASSEAIGEEADLRATIGEGDGGVEHGELMAAFAEAVVTASDELDEVREALLAALGAEAFVEAAATVGVFNGLVRTADSTGIPLDPRTVNSAEQARAQLGLNDFAGAVSSGIER